MSSANATAADGPSGLGLFFVDTTQLPATGFGDVQIIFLILIYGYVLYLSAKLIADGSELLAVVLDPGLVGGLLLPVMGAVPDAAIVLFSGLGADAQEQLKVGVGTLAGSTIMLLTLPWFACAWAGRVDLIGGGAAGAKEAPTSEALLGSAVSDAAASKPLACNYSPKNGAPKLTPGQSWASTCFRTGVQPTATVRGASVIMLLTCAGYLIIQGPAFAFETRSEGAQAAAESAWALAGLIVAALLFASYSAYCVLAAGAIEQQKRTIHLARLRAVEAGLVDIVTLMLIEDEHASGAPPAEEHRHHALHPASAASMRDARKALAAQPPGQGGAAAGERLPSSQHLRRLFDRLDTDGSGALDFSEVRVLVNELGLSLSDAQLKAIMADLGGDDSLVQFKEFESMIRHFATGSGASAPAGAAEDAATASAAAFDAARALGLVGSVQRRANASTAPSEMAAAGKEGAGKAEAEAEEEDDEEEEEEEEEDGSQGLSPMQIKIRAAATLALGLVVCVVFSDPMVDALTEIGNRWGISPFYVSFIVTPVVSNASELLSSLQFSAKKSRRSIDMTYAQLVGAATMNNTMALCVFLVLVYARNLAWNFSAEVLTILAVEVVIAALTLSNRNNVLPIWKAACAALLFPLSLVLVWLLENVAGLQ